MESKSSNSKIPSPNDGINLINSLIEDSSSKSEISDGVFTLGELHSDRASLFLGLINIITKIYELKKVDISEILWYSKKNHLGVMSRDNFIHCGIKVNDHLIGILISDMFLETLKSKGAKEIDKSPNYPPLNKSLSTFGL